MSKNQQVLLPFPLEGKTASRAVVREVSINSDHLRKIGLDLIRIRPQFNARIKPEGVPEDLWEKILMIPDLADGIYANNGPADPLKGDIYSVDSMFYVSDGERRLRALRHLINTDRGTYPDGSSVSEVVILLNPPGTTDLERTINILTTQNNLPLTPTQKGYYFKSIKDQYDKSSDEVAGYFGISRASVDNYIMITELSQETQDKIDSGEIKHTNAISDFRKSKKKGVLVDLESGEIVDEGDSKPTPPEPSKGDGDENEFEEQDNSITFPGSMGGAPQGGSGAHVVGKDSIYMDKQKEALWRQFLNRLDVVSKDLDHNEPINNAADEIMSTAEIITWKENELIIRLKNEYNLTVK